MAKQYKDQQLPRQKNDTEIAKEINTSTKSMLKKAKKISVAHSVNQKVQQEAKKQQVKAYHFEGSIPLKDNRRSSQQVTFVKPQANLKQQLEELQQMTQKFQNEISKMNQEYEQMNTAGTNIHALNQTIMQKATALSTFNNEIMQQIGHLKTLEAQASQNQL